MHDLNRALFLDRDGVVNIEKDYVYKIEDFEFMEGIFELCKHYKNLGYLIFIITNQSGISRGFYSEDDFSRLSFWMLEEFAVHGISITKVYHCPHHPDISGECSCRKPHAGMLFEAQREFKVDLKNSVLVGDKERDIEAGINAGLCEMYLFDESHTVTNSKATKIVTNLNEIYMGN